MNLRWGNREDGGVLTDLISSELDSISSELEIRDLISSELGIRFVEFQVGF